MAINVTNPQGGGMGVSTDLNVGGVGGGAYGGALSDLFQRLAQRALDAQTEKMNEHQEDRIRAQQASNKTGAQNTMDQYAQQQMRDQTLLANQRAQPLPTKTISGPQIIPGQVTDTSKLLLGNQPNNSTFGGPQGAQLTSPGASTTPGMSTGNGPADEIAQRQQQLQISALANLQNKANGY